MRHYIQLSSLMLLISSGVFADDSMQKNAQLISKHYSAQPSVYQLDEIPQEQLSDKITRQYVMGAQSTVVQWTLKKGALIPLHIHANEETTWVTQGAIKVSSQGKEFIVKPGAVLIIPPNVPHEFLALEDTVDIEFFAPAREDWITSDVSKK
jgi:quercetin dioxygenase-like cupin family protein